MQSQITEMGTTVCSEEERQAKIAEMNKVIEEFKLDLEQKEVRAQKLKDSDV